MAYISQYKYYENEGVNPESENWGSYQYVSLDDIVNNFILMYTGDRSLINNEPRYKIIFHAKRAIQELNYDAFREIKVLQLPVSDSLQFVLPHDYVNWVRISLYKNGILYPLSENIQIGSATTYLKDNNDKLLFDQDGNVLSPQFSGIDLDRISGQKVDIYMNTINGDNYAPGWRFGEDYVYEVGIGARYGLETEVANVNPTFRIDKKSGVIYFNSDMSGEQCILEYVSDGMENGNDSSISVNKLFEHYIYAAIEYEVLNSKFGVQEYIINRARKKRRSLYSNAKLRMSNMHPGRLLMSLRGQGKWIK
jgi:hypothetical protein